MSNERHVHTKEVNVDGLDSALIPTRKVRLALDVLWGNLPPRIETDDISKALDEIHDRLCEAELYALRTHGLIYQYAIIRPLDMTDLPDAETLQKISSAVRTLDDLGLIVGPGGDA